MMQSPKLYEVVMLLITAYVFFTLTVDVETPIIENHQYLFWISLALFAAVGITSIKNHYNAKIWVAGAYLIYHFYITMSLVQTYPNLALVPMAIIGIWIAAESYMLIGLAEDERKLRILNAGEYDYNEDRKEGEPIGK